MHTTSVRSMARWLVALPVLMVGALFYWSLALSLGGLSLMRFMALASPPQAQATDSALDDADVDMDVEIAPSDVAMGPVSPILVRLQESAEPQDFGDTSGTGGTVVPDEQAATPPTPGPGSTSY
ncbi:MAG TPA: hypothetical protein VHJ20_08600 [Polyangia bacterium]|nr:hypothetical protein [Polyangia bacterium]